MKEYAEYDAVGLAALVRQKEVSPEQLLEEAIGRAEAINPKLNAIITTLYDYGRSQIKAGLPDGEFRGVPFLLKDLLSELEGTPHSQGSAAYRGHISPASSNLVKRYLSAGLVVFGKTNTPEFGLLGVTEPRAFGPARNPWNPDRTPGGSSGGSAAAVAAGIVPVASAGDGGGSIRIPASCCGLFGLKPSRGLTPAGPFQSALWDGAAIEHVISRSVRDSVAMLDSTCGPDNATPYPLSKPAHPFSQAMHPPSKPLRIGFTTTSPLGLPISKHAINGVKETCKLLTDLGHQVEPVELDIDGEQLINSYLALYHAHIGAQLKKASKQFGTSLRKLNVEPETRSLGMVGHIYSATDFVLAQEYWNTLSQVMSVAHETYDVILTPVMADMPSVVGELELAWWEKIGMQAINTFGLHRLLHISGMVKQSAMKMFSQYPFTQIANFTGQPAMSVPLCRAHDMPLGMQFIAPLGGDETLIQLAIQLEEAKPWFNVRPELA